MSAADVLSLQGLVGNRGVQRAIQRQEHPAGAPTSPGPAAAISGRYLPDDRRDTLRHQVTLRLATAYTDYALACEEVKRDLAEEIEQNTEIAMAVVGVFLGPVGGAAGRLFHDYLNNLPTTASTVATRAALLALDHEEQIRDFADEHAPDVAEKLVGALAGREQDADEAVIGALRTGFRETIDDVAGSFDRMTDTRLVAVWANYDPSVATQEHYRREIRRVVEEARERRREEIERRRREERARQEEHNRGVRARGPEAGEYIYTPAGSRVYY